MTADELLVDPTFLPPETCSRLALLIDRHAADPQARRIPTRDEIPAVVIAAADPAARLILGDIRRRVAVLANHHQPSTIEFTLASRLGPGGHHPLHADNVTATGEPNHTPWRDYAAMLYLGGPTGGGELDFPHIGLRITPQAGTLILFPCGALHTHQVLTVTGGARYSLALWLTGDPAHTEPWPA